MFSEMLVCQRVLEGPEHGRYHYIRTRLCDLPSAKQVDECIMSLKEERKLLTIGLLWSWWDTRTQSQINVGEARRTTDEVI